MAVSFWCDFLLRCKSQEKRINKSICIHIWKSCWGHWPCYDKQNWTII